MLALEDISKISAMPMEDEEPMIIEDCDDSTATASRSKSKKDTSSHDVENENEDDAPSYSDVKSRPKEENLPWIEKYRPKRFEDVVGNDDTIDRLKSFSQKGNMPNLMLVGPPGVGKTTTILCLARILLGPSFRDAVLELNASNERGIEVVRNKIKMFSQQKVSLSPGKHKIIILDEADSMTDGAQQALRRTMELYSQTTRFALACNNSEKIIEPIQSRCAVVRFGRLPDKNLFLNLEAVCKAENLIYSDTGLEAIVFSAQGDMRQALNSLQATHHGFGNITPDNVYKVCDEPSPILIKDVLTSCKDGKIDDAYKKLHSLWRQGYSAEDIITILFRVSKSTDALPECTKILFIKEIGMTHMRIAEGLGTWVQLSGLLGVLAGLCFSEEPN